MKDLTGKRVVVTGAGSGIGRATAGAFAAAGARVIVCDLDEAGLAAVAADLGAACQLARRVDVADRGAMAAFAAEVHADGGPVDVIVNNAGVAFAGTLLETPPAQFDWLMGINLGGVVHGCQLFVPPMIERRRGGHVVNIASVFGLYGAPGVAAYCASKFAVLGLSQSLRAELRPHGIGVSAICPGMIATAIVERSHTPAGVSMQAAIETFRKRGAPPAKVAAAIVDAVRRERAVVPVTPHAWALWGLARAAPSVLERLGERVVKAIHP